jgi:K+-transporting ATPase KdpF subunit
MDTLMNGMLIFISSLTFGYLLYTLLFPERF